MKKSYFTRVTRKVAWKLVIILLGSVLFLNKTSPVQAQAIVFTEDFSGGLEKWYNYRYPEYWSIVDEKLEAYVPGPGRVTEMIPKDEYWNPLWTNYEFEYDLTPLQGVDKNTLFGFSDPMNWYEIHFNSFGLFVEKVSGGIVPFSAHGSSHLTNGQTYHIKISFNEGHIKVIVDDQVVVDKLDTTFNGDYGKIGLKAGTGASYPTRLQYDNIVVRWLDAPVPEEADISLGVPSYHQTDQQWASHEYDHASSWSQNPTIERWGCLTTSLAMILDFHGIEDLPNGDKISPDTLNTWLQGQADGYLGNGLVNWIAVTRLTHQISQEFGTPKLEYLYQKPSNYLSNLVTELKKGHPPIIELDGHFVASNGFTKAEDDILINDPYYEVESLGNHHLPVRSIRTLTPSQTDLSYLVITHKPGLNVNITNETGQSFKNEEISQESLTDPISGEKTQPLFVRYLAKPDDQKIRISVSQSQIGPYHLTIWDYDSTGELNDISHDGWAGPQAEILKISRQGSGLAKVESNLTFPGFREILRELKRKNQITNSTYRKLLILARTIEKINIQRVRHSLARYISIVITNQRPPISQEIQTYLNYYLEVMFPELQIQTTTKPLSRPR